MGRDHEQGPRRVPRGGHGGGGAEVKSKIIRRKGAKTRRIAKIEEGEIMDENALSYEVVGAAIEVHRVLGSGLLESVYRQALSRELSLRGIVYESEVALQAGYKGISFDAAYRLDILVERKLVVELKAVETLQPLHFAQLLSYLRLSGCRLGLLINFNAPRLRQGIRRVVNGL
jgi:GxxExxY protein